MDGDHERKMKGCFDLDLEEDHVVEQVDHEMEQGHEMVVFDLDMEDEQWMEQKIFIHEMEGLQM